MYSIFFKQTSLDLSLDLFCRFSAEESDAHLLLDVGPLEDLLELLEGDEVVLVDVGLHDGPLGDGHQLLLTDVGTHL